MGGKRILDMSDEMDKRISKEFYRKFEEHKAKLCSIEFDKKMKEGSETLRNLTSIANVRKSLGI